MNDHATPTTDAAARWCRANEPENDGAMNPLRLTRCLWQVLRLTIAPDSTARRWVR